MSKRREHLEHEVRRRVAEALTQQGVGYNRVALEVLYLLPPEFVQAYVQLFYSAFREDTRIRAGSKNAKPIRRREGVRGPAKPVKKYREHWQIEDEQAFSRKKRIDRQLRKLIPQMYMDTDNRHRARCGGCGRWVEERWMYCAWCGGNTRAAVGRVGNG